MTFNQYSEEAIEQIDSLFATQDFVGEDREVTITIRVKSSEVFLEEYSKPRYVDVGPFRSYPLRVEQRYYRISLRNPTPPQGSHIMEIKYPQQFSYYRLGLDPHSTYYKKTEGRDKMQWFMPGSETWGESVYSDVEDYASQETHGRMYQVNFTDLPAEIQELEEACE